MSASPSTDADLPPGLDLDAGDLCAVVLAGGAGVRMGGMDKASIEHAGRTLLDLAIEVCVDAAEVVVVGEEVRTARPVTFVLEDPPEGGPVAGLLTGRDALFRRPTTLAVVAVDMPGLSPGTLRRLRAAAAGRDGAFLVEPGGGGRRQLAGVLDVARLDAVRPGVEEQHGMPMHRLLEHLDLADVVAEGGEADDIDTWEDVRRLRERGSAGSRD